VPVPVRDPDVEPVRQELTQRTGMRSSNGHEGACSEAFLCSRNATGVSSSCRNRVRARARVRQI
jgi:hypothetical protein